MSRYNFPVKWHRFSTDEFTQKKAEHIAKYGYTVYVPGFQDIFKLGINQPPTEEELAKYRPDRPGELSVYRWEQIKDLKRRKRESFLRMMSSPIPTWAKNVGTAMTFLDDVNDTLGTVAVIARYGMKMFPKLFGKLLMGPAGWALMVADICNIAQQLSTAPMRALLVKPKMYKGLVKNPFTKKSALARAKKLRRHGIGKGELIEALQVTDNVMGVGLCLGPLWGLVQDIIFGMYRVAAGKRVDVYVPFKYIAPHEALGQNVQKAVEQLWTGGQEMSDEDHARCVLAAYAGQILSWPVVQDWNPLDNLSDISAVEIRAPWPKDPLTLSIFREEGINPYAHTGFLHLDKEYANPMELVDVCEPLIQSSWREYTQRTKNTHMGHMTSQALNDIVENNYALCEGEEAVVIDFTFSTKLFSKMFENGWKLAEQDDPNALACMADTIEGWGERYLAYRWDQLQGWLERQCKVKFTRETPK